MSLNQGSVYHDVIRTRDAGLTVLDFYTRRYPHTDEAGWCEAIREGRVLRADRPLSPDAPLATGDRLAYHRLPWREPPAPRAFDVLYEDDEALAVAKPSGLPVLPGGGFLESTLLHLVRVSRADRAAASPIHRLGRGTSGIVLFGKTAAARRALSEEFRSRRATKIYVGVAAGLVQPNLFVARYPIGLVAHPNLPDVHATTAGGKHAETRFRVVRRDAAAGLSLVLAHLITGRPHQIRIHLAAAGFPLAGDPFYVSGGQARAVALGNSNPPRVGDCGYRLHAARVRIDSPGGGNTLEIDAPIPAAFFEDTPFNERDLPIAGGRAWDDAPREAGEVFD